MSGPRPRPLAMRSSPPVYIRCREPGRVSTSALKSLFLWRQLQPALRCLYMQRHDVILVGEIALAPKPVRLRLGYSLGLRPQEIELRVFRSSKFSVSFASCLRVSKVDRRCRRVVRAARCSCILTEETSWFGQKLRPLSRRSRDSRPRLARGLRLCSFSCRGLHCAILLRCGSVRKGSAAELRQGELV